MSFIKSWSPYFQSNIRIRGRAIQAAGKVRLIEPQSGELARAEVQGTRLYTVVITEGPQRGSVHCTCQHFADGSHCKHIWATLLELRRRAPEMGEGDGESTVDARIDQLSPPPPKARKRTGEERERKHREPEWVGRLSLMRASTSFGLDGAAQQGAAALSAALNAGAPRLSQVCYVVHPELSNRHGGLVVDLRQRDATATGWSRQRKLKISSQTIDELPDPADRELCALILGATWVSESDSGEHYGDDRGRAAFRIQRGAWRGMMRRMIDTGRCFVEREGVEPAALHWDSDEPWVLWLRGVTDGGTLDMHVELRRGDDRMAVTVPELILGSTDGLLIARAKASPFDDRDAFRWVAQYRDDARRHDALRPIRVPLNEVDLFLERLYMLPHLPEIDMPAGVGRQAISVKPKAHIEILSPQRDAGASLPPGERKDRLTARVWFEYNEHRVKPGQPGRFVNSKLTAPMPIDEDAGDGDEAAVGADDVDVIDVDDDVESMEPADTTGLLADEQDGDDVDGEIVAAPIRRDHRFESEAIHHVIALGLRPHASNGIDTLTLSPRQLPTVVMDLLSHEWVVTADQRALRRPGPSRMNITSGIDWFELRGTIDYQTESGVVQVSLPDILAAARAGKNMIELGDGSQGMLPEEWLAAHGLLTAIGRVQPDHLRFRASQAALLDALLSEQELEHVDDRFAEVRDRLRKFQGIAAVDPDPGFRGTLRPYQREALGWFEFLRWFGIGGILADDMGLGKTVQVLAMLDAWYKNKDGRPHQPALIVVPRSVVFNWIDESARFAPELRVQAYTGTDRQALRDAFVDHDVIVTSYGLMRRDIEELVNHGFDYLVLDEAQAIKNPNSQSAKAARLLKASHRLALTGTPVENHLGDLWSIFEYLNPGMLGSNTRFARMLRGGASASRVSMAGDGPSDEADESPDEAMNAAANASWQIAQALRPFILRRTKKQVLSDLPDKTEQTIVCEMEPEQRRIYDELREHYRGVLLKQIGTGPGESIMTGGEPSMMVLEALLRLRQAACHPGLIDEARADQPSAKLEALIDSLVELIDEGHKALVFSQFTSMLALVRTRLDAMKIPYAYLDGRTRDRRETVDHFQNDPKCPVFLISLKAGGLGLNLTAAEYVFILDPWWNPAVEQQAIDRTHRIGQTRHVFAYRMICENTIEQRIAELQEKKRHLAEAIVDGQQSLLRSLTREDLEMLLS